MSLYSEEGENVFCRKGIKTDKGKSLCASSYDGLVVRPMAEVDAGIVAKLTMEAFRSKFEWAVGKKSLQKILAGKAAENRNHQNYQHTIVAECGGKVVGSIGIKFFGDRHKLHKCYYKGMGCLPFLRLRIMVVSQNEDVKDPSMCYIDEVCVSEESRGKGVGAALLEAAEAEARKHGCTKMCLHVAVGNPAINLYLRAGYKKMHEEIDLIAYCIIGVKGWFRMEKDLVT